jgi:hypothetical protein
MKQGLGDKIESFTKATGIKKVVDKVSQGLNEGVLGKADRNGSILISKDIKDPKQIEDVVNHEKVHIDQMKRGDLDYDDSAVYWRGKRYSRAKMQEGAKNLPWEKEAYAKSKEKI